MATRKGTPAPDPAEAANQKVLEERERRILSHMPPDLDMGLELEQKEPASAVEMIDEWDRKAFGGAPATIKKIVYGPDPLIDQCPELRQAIEKHGLHDYIALMRETVMLKGASAFDNPLMRRGAQAAINKFGKEKFTDALEVRLLKIPVREIEIDASDVLDPLILGGNVLRDTVDQYKRPGMSYKFLSQRCMDVFGKRGYEIVKDARGDPVKAGTLYLGEIRREIAEARGRYYAEQSNREVREIEDAFRETIARQAGETDARALRHDEMVTAGASETEALLGDSRKSGVYIERQGSRGRQGDV